MSKGVDQVLAEGNLTMGQVSQIFQASILEEMKFLKEVKDSGGTILICYSIAVPYLNDKNAKNFLLNQTIQDFLNGKAPLPQGYKK